jgi:hypothetical protein
MPVARVGVALARSHLALIDRAANARRGGYHALRYRLGRGKRLVIRTEV